MVFEGGSDEDRAMIEALHRADEAASLSQDFATLRTLMSDEAVVLAPGARPLRGRAEIDAAFSRPGPATVEILRYAFHWEEVRVLGDHAFEWGRIDGEMRPADADADVAPTRESYNVLRILRRGVDGWKVHRTIWNERPA